MTAFAARLKNVTCPESVRNNLVGTIHRALKPAHLSVWGPPPPARPAARGHSRLAIPARAFARHDEASGGWVRPPGEFSVPHRQVFG